MRTSESFHQKWKIKGNSSHLQIVCKFKDHCVVLKMKYWDYLEWFKGGIMRKINFLK